MKSKFLLIFTLVIYMVSCGNNNKSSSFATPSRLHINNFVLLEFSTEDTLSPKYPSTTEFDYKPEPYPTLTFSSNQHTLATLYSMQPYSPPYTPSAYQNPSYSCQLEQPLKNLVQLLARISYAKEPYTQIPQALASLPSCPLQQALTCFLKTLSLTPWENISSAQERAKLVKQNILLLSQCSGIKNIWRTKDYFFIKDDFMYFSPDPLYSIRIFEGKQTSYTWANDNLDSVAKLINIDCLKNCFTSPIKYSKLFECNSCRPLTKGQVYTAFLQTQRSEIENNFARVTFTAP